MSTPNHPGWIDPAAVAASLTHARDAATAWSAWALTARCLDRSQPAVVTIEGHGPVPALWTPLPTARLAALHAAVAQVAEESAAVADAYADHAAALTTALTSHRGQRGTGGAR